MAMQNPPHPGELIRTEVIAPLGLSVSEAARKLKVRRATVSDLLAGKSALSSDMAMRIEQAFGPDMHHLLDMQVAYDVSRKRSTAVKPANGRTRMPANRPSNIVVKNLLPEIPTELAKAMGEMAIRMGALERAIITASARIQCADEENGGNQDRYIELLGRFKKFKTLGGLITSANKQFAGRDFNWFDQDSLRCLAARRNVIHDALVEDPDGILSWQASSNRPHRLTVVKELLRLRDEAMAQTQRINDGSLAYKRGHRSILARKVAQ